MSQLSVKTLNLLLQSSVGRVIVCVQRKRGYIMRFMRFIGSFLLFFGFVLMVLWVGGVM